MKYIDDNINDHLLEKIAEYALHKEINNEEAFEAARLVLMDSLGCAMLTLRYPECTKHLGPIVPGTFVPNGSRVPGTQFELDPVQAAFNISCLIRWLDYSDTWLAAEWGHPSDNLGGILAVADYISRKRVSAGKEPMKMKQILELIIKAHEIQGMLAIENSLNRVGLDHVLFVKVASTAVVTSMLGGTKEEIVNALSNAWIDNSSLRTYRHAPNTGSRKSWAAGDATSRGVRFAFMAINAEMGYKTALSAPGWGFQDVLFDGNELKLTRDLDSYVIKNILFKIAYPAEFHAQTALECALELHDQVAERLEEIDKITIHTHESALRIIDKTGPLHNPADRDHCLQYITAIGLLFGEMTSDHYEDNIARDSRIDHLREKMVIVEDRKYSKDYLDPNKRSIANAIQVSFKNGDKLEKVEREYPLGHPRRRTEGLPLLLEKFETNIQTRFPSNQAKDIYALFHDSATLQSMNVNEFIERFII